MLLINSISQLRLAALLLVQSFTNLLYKGRCWVMQGKGKKKRERKGGETEETFGKLYSNCLKSFKKKKKKKVLRMKNWSIDLFNQELTQELSFRGDKTEIKWDTRFQILHFWHSEQFHISETFASLSRFPRIQHHRVMKTKHILWKPPEIELSIPFFLSF